MRRRPEAARTWDNVVTDAVFHAPMSALNADNWPGKPNACEPNHMRSTPMESAHIAARIRVRPYPHAHMRAHTRGRTRVHVSHVGASMGHAHIGDPIIDADIGMDIDTCIYHE